MNRDKDQVRCSGCNAIGTWQLIDQHDCNLTAAMSSWFIKEVETP